jgi:8-oxo-dGTP pyrophosphatase MutT (NUDIX family)
MAQTYAVVYDSSGNFFIAVKNTRSYFYHSDSDADGTIYPCGFPVTNGPGLRALPGGKLTASDPAIGAANEFAEETGVELRDFNLKLLPEAWHAKDGKLEYYGVYFHVSPEIFEEISNSAIANLETGVTVSDEIQNRQIQAYADIVKQFPSCPKDNELASGVVWNLEHNWADIAKLDARGTDWFYVILKHLRDHLGGQYQR